MKRILSVIIGIIIVSSIFSAYAYGGENENRAEIVKESIGETDLEVEFSSKLHIYKGDNVTFDMIFRNYNDKLRYFSNVALEAEEKDRGDISISMMKKIRGVTVNPEDDYPLVYWINPQKTGTYNLTLSIDTDYFGSMSFIEDLIHALPLLASMIPALIYAIPAVIPFATDYVLYIPVMIRGLILDVIGSLEELKPLFDDVMPSVFKHFDFLLYLILGGLKITIPQLPSDIAHWIKVFPEAIGDTISSLIAVLPHLLSWWISAIYGIMKDTPQTIPRLIRNVAPALLSVGLSYRYYLPEDIAYAMESLFPNTLIRLIVGPILGAVLGAAFGLIAWLLIMIPTFIPTLSLTFWLGTPIIILGALGGAVSGAFPSVGKSLALLGHGVSPEKGSGEEVYTVTIEVTEKSLWVRLHETAEMWMDAITSFFSTTY